MIPLGYLVGIPIGYHGKKKLNETKHIIERKKKKKNTYL
jgi:hypothetical protein